jgi:uncharacterized protein YlaI
MNKRRLLHEFWMLYPKFIKENPELAKSTGRKALNAFIKKHGGAENALQKLIELNGTKNIHTIFCEDCGHRIDENEEKMGLLVRGRILCYKHQCCPMSKEKQKKT